MKLFLRPTFLFLAVPALFAGCAHSPNAERAPAGGETVGFNYDAGVNPKDAEGAYYVSVQASFPTTATRTFASIVDVFRGVDVTNVVSRLLAERKPSPLNNLRSEASFEKPRSGYDLAYVVNGYPVGLKLFGSKSKVDCHDHVDAKGHWDQECDADLGYKSTAKYMSAYHQKINCDLSGSVVNCRFDIDGTMKKIEVPGIAKSLFGASDYSATQAAYMAVENQLHSFYALAELLKQEPPFAPKAAKAVTDYSKSDGYAEATKIKKSYPADLTTKKRANSSGKF